MVTAKGPRPNLVLTYLKFDGRVLQKYYDLSAKVEEALVPDDVVVKMAKRLGKLKKRKRLGSILSVSVWEREPTVLDTITEVNSLMDPEAFENQEEFSIEFWMATLTITGLIVFFGIGIVYACIHENTAEQLKERRRKMHKMFLKDGYINTYQLRHAEAETATMCRLLLFAFQRSHIAVSTVTALLPFNCKNWKRARKMLRIELPAAARVMLLTMKVITPCTNPEPCP